jgi:hypothetical protein
LSAVPSATTLVVAKLAISAVPSATALSLLALAATRAAVGALGTALWEQRRLARYGARSVGRRRPRRE